METRSGEDDGVLVNPNKPKRKKKKKRLFSPKNPVFCDFIGTLRDVMSQSGGEVDAPSSPTAVAEPLSLDTLSSHLVLIYN